MNDITKEGKQFEVPAQLKALGDQVIRIFTDAEDKIISQIMTELLKRPATEADLNLVTKVQYALHEAGEYLLMYQGVVIGLMKWNVPDWNSFHPGNKPDPNFRVGVEFVAAKNFKKK